MEKKLNYLKHLEVSGEDGRCWTRPK